MNAALFIIRFLPKASSKNLSYMDNGLRLMIGISYGVMWDELITDSTGPDKHHSR